MAKVSYQKSLFKSYLRWIYSFCPAIWQIIGIIIWASFCVIVPAYLVSISFESDLLVFWTFILGAVLGVAGVYVVGNYENLKRNGRSIVEQALDYISNWWRSRPK